MVWMSSPMRPDRAGGKYRDGLGFENVVGLPDRLSELFLAAENDLVLLHVGVHAVLHVIDLAGFGPGQVAAGHPGVKAAADRAVGDLEQIVNRPHDHTAATGVSAAALGDDAGDGARVGRDFGRRFRIVGENLFRALLPCLGRIDFQHLLPNRVRIGRGNVVGRFRHIKSSCVLGHRRRAGLAGADADGILQWAPRKSSRRRDCRCG